MENKYLKKYRNDTTNQARPLSEATEITTYNLCLP